jgi:hypothetical protein
MSPLVGHTGVLKEREFARIWWSLIDLDEEVSAGNGPMLALQTPKQTTEVSEWLSFFQR